MAKTKPSRKTASTSTNRSVPRRKQRSAATPPRLLGKNLERAVEEFQSEPDEKKAHEQWKQIEASVFGVRFED
jgi:hypothetical protein